MKSIVLSTKIKIDQFNKINFIIDYDLSKFVGDLNLNITPISLNKKNKIDFSSMRSSSGLIIAGGGDLYKYKKTKENKIRDDYERALFNFFLRKNKPILTICRGFQLLADLNNIKLFKIKNHIRKFHNLSLNKSKFINCSSLNVNSYHKY
mgnify:CR=1 FL=1